MEIATIGSLLTPLALLACPVGMGLMMWMMMRGHNNETGSLPERDPVARVSHASSPQPPSLEVLREEQQRLSDQIEQLEGRRRTPRTGRSA